MYGHYESTQSVEVGIDDEYQEVEFSFTLDCTSPGCPARLGGPPEDSYPAEAAEFELGSIHVLEGESKSTKISEETLAAIIGRETVEEMIEKAIDDAIENGEF